MVEFHSSLFHVGWLKIGQAEHSDKSFSTVIHVYWRSHTISLSWQHAVSCRKHSKTRNQGWRKCCQGFGKEDIWTSINVCFFLLRFLLDIIRGKYDSSLWRKEWGFPVLSSVTFINSLLTFLISKLSCLHFYGISHTGFRKPIQFTLVLSHVFLLFSEDFQLSSFLVLTIFSIFSFSCLTEISYLKN